MAKRFTDTDKWKKPFIRSLSAEYKLLWFYILDDCDISGVWEVDFEVASIRTGMNLDEKKAKEIFGDHIEIFDGGKKWFIRDFIGFQYGELKDTNSMHRGVSTQLNKYSSKGLYSPFKGAKEKDTEKEEEKVKVKEEEFGKSENLLNDGSIISEMWHLWRKTFPKYTADKKKDFEPLGQILDFMCKQRGKPYCRGDDDISILNTFQLIADYVRADGFYVNKALSTVSNKIQEFYNNIKNPITEKNGTGKHNGKTGKKYDDSKLQAIIADRYGVRK